MCFHEAQARTQTFEMEAGAWGGGGVWVEGACKKFSYSKKGGANANKMPIWGPKLGV